MPFQYSFNHSNSMFLGGSLDEEIRFDINVTKPGQRQLLANKLSLSSSMQRI